MNARKSVTQKNYNFQATFRIILEGASYGKLIYGRYATKEGAEKSLKKANKDFKRWELVSVEEI